MSHHYFRKAITLYQINPQEYESDIKNETTFTLKRKCSSSTASVSSISMDSSIKKSKFIKTGIHHVTDESLCPNNGSLKCRLDKNVDHIPMESQDRARFRLHWWGGVETKSQVLSCPGCGVNLCSRCYRFFHTNSDIVSMRDKLKKIFKNKNPHHWIVFE